MWNLSCENAYTDRSCLGWFSLWPLIWTPQKTGPVTLATNPLLFVFLLWVVFSMLLFLLCWKKKHLLASSISMNLKLLWDELCVSEWNTSYSSLHFKCIVRQPQKRNSFYHLHFILQNYWAPDFPLFQISF